MPLTAGARLALRVFASRDAAHASALLVYAVDDGAVLATQALPCTHASATSMAWIALEAPAAASQALAMLRTLAPLPPLEPVGAPAGTHARMPHARAAPPAAVPSAGMARGDGVLAQLPALARAAGDEHTSLLLVADGGHTLRVFLDGTVGLGACALGGAGDGALMRAAATEASVLVGDGAALAAVRVALPVRAALPAVMHLAELSTGVRHALAHAADAVASAAQAWRTLARPRAAEWHAQLEDLSKRYAVDLGVELMTLVMTGRGGPASEQLVLHNLTEGVRTKLTQATIAMEQDARRGLKLVRRYAGTTLAPACERLLLLLQELQGCAAWPERFARFALPAAELAGVVGEVQTCLAVAHALQEQAERELLALDEFFKWWRMGTSVAHAEQDRQERLKTEEARRAIPTHDTLTVLELLRRGFVSPELDALLGGAPDAPARAPPADASMDDEAPPPAVADAAEALFADAPRGASPPPIAESVRAALAHLDAPHTPPPAPVYAVPQLFVAPEHAFRGARTLPGDAQPLAARVAHITARIAALLSDALARTMHGAHTTHTRLGAWDAVRRDAAWSSAPADAPAPALLAPLVRSAGRYTVLLETDAQLRVVRADGLAAVVPVPDAIDVGFRSETHVVVLYGRAAAYALGVLALPAALYDEAPRPTPLVWQRTLPVSWDEGAPQRIAVHGATVVVLGDDDQTLASVTLLE